MAEQLLLRTKDVARALGISHSTVAAWDGQGKLPASLKICGVRRWRANEIREFVDNLQSNRATA